MRRLVARQLDSIASLTLIGFIVLLSCTRFISAVRHTPPQHRFQFARDESSEDLFEPFSEPRVHLGITWRVRVICVISETTL